MYGCINNAWIYLIMLLSYKTWPYVLMWFVHLYSTNGSVRVLRRVNVYVWAGIKTLWKWNIFCVCGGFPSQMPVTRSFGVFFYLHLNQRLRKQSISRWFETQSRSLWHHCNACDIYIYICIARFILCHMLFCCRCFYVKRKVNEWPVINLYMYIYIYKAIR